MNDGHMIAKFSIPGLIPDAYSMETIYQELFSEDLAIETAMRDLKKYSKETYHHSLRVAMYAVYFANALSMECASFHNLIKGALVHDIGKIKIPYDILNFPGSFNSEQRNMIQMHPLYGVEYFKEKKLDIPKDIHDIIIQHHECCDKTGYPFGLHKQDINDFARIVTICDIYEAYIAERVYHPRKSCKEGIDYIEQLSWKGKLDAEYSKLFIDIVT